MDARGRSKDKNRSQNVNPYKQISSAHNIGPFRADSFRTTRRISIVIMPVSSHIGMLDLRLIRRDGETQARVTMDQAVVNEYAALMKMGVEFPPVRVWFDGNTYWLSDGFQRSTAAQIVGAEAISAIILQGSLEDAQWDSYAANSSHGLRRTRSDVEAVTIRCLKHSKSSQLSNWEIARHLNISEPTIRRWRARVSTSDDVDTTRIAVRGGKAYSIQIANIGGRANCSCKPKALYKLRGDFDNIKALASPGGRLLLDIFGSWIFGGMPATVCLDRIEEAVQEFSRPTRASRKRD
jgi:hypothetical protein